MQIGSYTRKNIKSFCNRFQRTKLSRQLASLLRQNAVKGFFRLVPLSCFPRLTIIIRLEFENARFINEITKNISIACSAHAMRRRLSSCLSESPGPLAQLES